MEFLKTLFGQAARSTARTAARAHEIHTRHELLKSLIASFIPGNNLATLGYGALTGTQVKHGPIDGLFHTLGALKEAAMVGAFGAAAGGMTAVSEALSFVGTVIKKATGVTASLLVLEISCIINDVKGVYRNFDAGHLENMRFMQLKPVQDSPAFRELVAEFPKLGTFIDAQNALVDPLRNLQIAENRANSQHLTGEARTKFLKPYQGDALRLYETYAERLSHLSDSELAAYRNFMKKADAVEAPRITAQRAPTTQARHKTTNNEPEEHPWVTRRSPLDGRVHTLIWYGKRPNPLPRF